MDEAEFKAVVKRLKAVSAVVKELDPTLRGVAIDVLKGYLAPEGQRQKHAQTSKREEGPATPIDVDAGSFFSGSAHTQPAENAKAIAAFFYGQYGTAPFSIAEVEAKASEVGLTIPARLDKTFLGSKEGGKSLFARAGKGQFRPTVSGEQYFKATYRVSKGKDVKAGAANG